MTHRSNLATITLCVALGLVAGGAFAHTDAPHKPRAGNKISPDEHPFGREGDPKKISRTVTIDMADSMRFTPDNIKVKVGQTIRFKIKNGGQVLHEMVLGTEEELKKHAELMKKNPGMEHEEPYMAHVKPGAREEIVWRFTKAGEFKFACLIPGHFEAGMIGRISVTAK